MNEKMTNQSLRERFNLPEKKSEAISRAIRDSVEAGKIKLTDPEQASLRYRSYCGNLRVPHRHHRWRSKMKKGTNNGFSI